MPRGTARDRALGLLAVRWRSREEIRRRLRSAGYDPGEIDPVLDDLERVGLIEDERFAREMVRDQAGRRLAGGRAIRSALRAKGVAPDLVERALSDAGEEAERAKALASRRVARMANLPPEAAYRRLFGLLVRRGYDSAVAREACREALSAVLEDAETIEESP